MGESSGIYRLYGDSRSGNCYKPAWVLNITGRPYDWRETDIMARESRTESFLAMNPNGRVPLLVLPDGRMLAESNAMLLHLAESSPLLPADAYERALVYQWMFFEQYSHEPYIAVARFIIRYAKTAEEERARLEQLSKRGYDALAVMETRLSESPFFAGERFTVADIALYAYTHVADEGEFDLAPYPKVRRWLSNIEALPEYVSMEQACR
jgi:glutathione S-transferase